jgi:hypothetical protein
VPTAEHPVSLLHPLFLDVSMLTGLIAQLGGRTEQGGWAPPGLEGALDVLDRWQPAEGAPVPPVASSPVVHYIATGLLHALHGHLAQQGLLSVVATSADIADLKTGDLVEVAGTCVGNPFEDLLGFYGAIIPQILQQEATRQALLEQLRQKSKTATRTRVTPTTSSATDELIEEMSGSGTDELAARLILALVDDVRRSPVRDVVLDAGDYAVVVTVGTRLLAADTLASMRGLRVRAIGKVAAVVTGDGTIDLAGRTMLGTLGGDVASDLVQNATTGPYEVAVADPTIPAPALRLLPLAVLL